MTDGSGAPCWDGVCLVVRGGRHSSLEVIIRYSAYLRGTQ